MLCVWLVRVIIQLRDLSILGNAGHLLGACAASRVTPSCLVTGKEHTQGVRYRILFCCLECMRDHEWGKSWRLQSWMGWGKLFSIISWNQTCGYCCSWLSIRMITHVINVHTNNNHKHDKPFKHTVSEPSTKQPTFSNGSHKGSKKATRIAVADLRIWLRLACGLLLVMIPCY